MGRVRHPRAGRRRHRRACLRHPLDTTADLLALVPISHVLVFLVHVDSHHPSDCHDCYSALGGAYHPFELFAVQTNVLGWVAGVALGAAMRRAGALLAQGDARLPAAS